MERSIEERASFDEVRYANCWEDADVLCEALAAAPGKRYLSVASGGDNSFALLAEGAEVVAADLSPAQLALVELKAAAVRRLSHPEALAFLGLRPDHRRLETLATLEPDLSPSAKAYWRGREPAIRSGIVHDGRFERYFKLFRARILPLVHRRRTCLALLQERDAAGRRDFYDRVWSSWRWRLLFRIFFSRFVMGRLGRDREFFRYVEGSVADHILARTRYALTELPTHRNPYVEYIVTGSFDRAPPRYLRPAVFAALKQNLDGLELFQGTVQEAATRHRGGGFDGFNLSDIFEYLDPELCHGIYRRLLETARPGARFAYWNMLVPRACPAELRSRVRPLDREAKALFRRDLAFFYRAFVLEEAC